MFGANINKETSTCLLTNNNENRQGLCSAYGVFPLNESKVEFCTGATEAQLSEQSVELQDIRPVGDDAL